MRRAYIELTAEVDCDHKDKKEQNQEDLEYLKGPFKISV